MSDDREFSIKRFYEDVGERVRQARQGKGLTQAQVAAKLGLTRSSVANLEAGRQRVPVHVLAMLVEHFGAQWTDVLPIGRYFKTAPLDESISRTLEGQSDTAIRFVKGVLLRAEAETRREI